MDGWTDGRTDGRVEERWGCFSGPQREPKWVETIIVGYYAIIVFGNPEAQSDYYTRLLCVRTPFASFGGRRLSMLHRHNQSFFLSLPLLPVSQLRRSMGKDFVFWQ